ncbi:7930_t:CDS:2, partial [Ambispora leptoticha]
ISNAEPKPADPEKLKLEKTIIRLEKEIKKGKEEMMKRKLSEEEISELYKKSYSLRENAPTLLFCGEEFNEQLMREKKSGNNSRKAVKDYNIIDFGQAENNKLDTFKKKIQEICKKTENLSERRLDGDSPIVWLKNIDKITDSELKKELLKVVDSSQNTNLGKLENPIDLSQFTLVATTSTTRPKLSNELRNKLRHIEPFLEKH